MGPAGRRTEAALQRCDPGDLWSPGLYWATRHQTKDSTPRQNNLAKRSFQEVNRAHLASSGSRLSDLREDWVSHRIEVPENREGEHWNKLQLPTRKMPFPLDSGNIPKWGTSLTLARRLCHHREIPQENVTQDVTQTSWNKSSSYTVIKKSLQTMKMTESSGRKCHGFHMWELRAEVKGADGWSEQPASFAGWNVHGCEHPQILSTWESLRGRHLP